MKKPVSVLVAAAFAVAAFASIASAAPLSPAIGLGVAASKNDALVHVGNKPPRGTLKKIDKSRLQSS